MAKTTTRKKTPTKAKSKGKKANATALPWPKRILRWFKWSCVGIAAFVLFAVGLFAFVNPPRTPYMLGEAYRLGSIDYQWVDLEEINAHLPRAVVAAEDANFCLHWGFDMAAIRDALEDGSGRGASTITQQVVKNVYLWHGRSWFRKALEAVLTPLVEAVWTKRRIIEVYLNVAEFGEGVFGAEAAARRYFKTGPDNLRLWQAARLAAILPAPKDRSAVSPTNFVAARTDAIADGAETIRADGRADCLNSG